MKSNEVRSISKFKYELAKWRQVQRNLRYRWLELDIKCNNLEKKIEKMRERFKEVNI